MDIKQLRYFLATVEHGNMTRAADQLHIAQPALSQQIAGLERDLDSKLLDRSARGVKPTVAGEVLYRHAKGLLRQVEDLKGAVALEKSQPSGRVALGVSGSIARILLVPLLAALQAYPGILMQVVALPGVELIGQLALGNIDMAIGLDALPQRGIAISPLFRESLYVVMPRQFNCQQPAGITLAELAQMPLVLPKAPDTIRTRLDLACLNAHVSYRLVAEVSVADLLVHAVEGGAVCTVLPRSAIQREIAEQRVQAMPFLPTPITREVSLCLPEHVPLGEAASVVRQLVRDILCDSHDVGAWSGSERIPAPLCADS